MNECHDVTENCPNYKELYEEEHKRYMDLIQSIKDEQRAKLEAEMHSLRQLADINKLNASVSLPEPNPYPYNNYGMCCDILPYEKKAILEGHEFFLTKLFKTDENKEEER